jgi:hypothetical protein
VQGNAAGGFGGGGEFNKRKLQKRGNKRMKRISFIFFYLE